MVKSGLGWTGKPSTASPRAWLTNRLANQRPGLRACLMRTASTHLEPPAWPTRRAMFSMGTPESDSSDTKLWRISRGVHSAPLRPAFVTIRRKDRRTLFALRCVPTAEANTRPCSCHFGLRRSFDGSGSRGGLPALAHSGQESQRAPRLPGLGVSACPHRAPHLKQIRCRSTTTITSNRECVGPLVKVAPAIPKLKSLTLAPPVYLTLGPIFRTSKRMPSALLPERHLPDRHQSGTGDVDA
jgi:hypothetical protein